MAETLLSRVELEADRLMMQALGQVFYEYNPATERDCLAGRYPAHAGISSMAQAPASSVLRWEERLHPAGPGRLFRKGWYRSSSQAEPYGIEYRVRRADGRYVRLLDRGGVLPGERTPRWSIGALYDMTALREAEDRLRDVVDAAGEFIWEVDAKGGIPSFRIACARCWAGLRRKCWAATRSSSFWMRTARIFAESPTHCGKARRRFEGLSIAWCVRTERSSG